MPRVLCVLILVLVGCRPTRHASSAIVLAAHAWLSAEVTPQEGILGRAVVDAGRVRLLTSGRRIVTLDIPRQRVTSVSLKDDEDGASLFGFAALPDGTLWTLSGWSTLLQVSEEGAVTARRTLR